MNEITDTLGVLQLDTWNATDSNVFSYLKTPIQQTFFANNSSLIGKTLRQAIIDFSETLNSIDRTACTLGNEFRSTRTRKYQIIHPETTTIEVTTFAPIAFEYLRSAINITRQDFQASFENGQLMDFTNTGKSGSQMYKTSDEVFMIKTLRDHEAKLLLQILSGLYLHYSHTPTLITRYVGLYSVNIRSIFPSEIYCVVMVNNLSSLLNIDEIYDLKGSIVGRISTVDSPFRRVKALKDLDFESFYPKGIRIPHEIYGRLKQTLQSDIFQLRKLMITDFSLILGVHRLDDERNVRWELKPQLGISSLFLFINHERTIPQSSIEKSHRTKNFILKPLDLIDYPQAMIFQDHPIANSFLGIPGVTHDGQRVLLYPAFIDCLQTYDHFKHIQHVLQNLRDPKRSTDYSVIHPDEYEKRLLRFLFERVFLDSKQTFNELFVHRKNPTPCPIEHTRFVSFDNDEILIERTVL